MASTALKKSGRSKANKRAVELVQESAERELTSDEIAEVALYTGQGAVGASLNQYFTRPDIAAAIWARAGALLGGPVTSALEPACGSGVFLATAPDGELYLLHDEDAE